MAGVDPGVTDTLAEVLTAGNATGGTSMVISSGDDVTFTGASANIVFDSSDSALEFADNAKAIFGAGSDLQIYHDGNDSYIQDSGTGLLFIRGSSSVRIQGANGESSIDANENGAVNLYYDNSNKLSTTSTGVDITGRLVTTSHIDAPDGAKVRLGDGDDLQIYHNGSNSLIEEAGTGSLYIRANTDFRVQSYSDNEEMIRATANGAVTLYNNNQAKLATTATGISVSGAVALHQAKTFTASSFKTRWDC